MWPLVEGRGYILVSEYLFALKYLPGVISVLVPVYKCKVCYYTALTTATKGPVLDLDPGR